MSIPTFKEFCEKFPLNQETLDSILHEQLQGKKSPAWRTSQEALEQRKEYLNYLRYMGAIDDKCND